MEKPDILALELLEAQAICKKAGWNVEIVYTRPPGRLNLGKPRVLQFKEISPGQGILIVAREQEVE